MTDATLQNARFLDLSTRFVCSTAVVGSPALAAETIVASVQLPSGIVVGKGVIVVGWLAFTVGTSGASAQYRIRQTSVAGTVVADSGATNGDVTAAKLLEHSIVGFDTAPADAQIYKLTLQVGSGAAASTVSAVALAAIAV